MVLTLIICFSVVICLTFIRDILTFEWNKRKTGISFKDSLTLTDLPVITLDNNGEKLNFLLDTGSNISHFNSEAMNLLKDFENIDKRGQSIITATGTSEADCWLRIPLKYKEQMFFEDFMLLDLKEAFDTIQKENGVQIHGILGNSFFIKYGYVLDFDNNIAYIK